MEAEARRKAIMKLLRDSTGPVTGSDLAQAMGVSRQVIVQDVALLRAQGEEVLATPQGYLMPARQPKATQGTLKTIAVRHRPDQMREELVALVRAGVTVLDVTVEHPVYGDLRGMLMLSTEHDVDEFMHTMASTGAGPLSALTDGVHLHTLRAQDRKQFLEAEKALRRLGFLLDARE